MAFGDAPIDFAVACKRLSISRMQALCWAPEGISTTVHLAPEPQPKQQQHHNNHHPPATMPPKKSASKKKTAESGGRKKRQKGSDSDRSAQPSSGRVSMVGLGALAASCQHPDGEKENDSQAANTGAAPAAAAASFLSLIHI